MTFDLNRISDPEYVKENRLDPHSDHRWFASAQEAATGTSSFEQSLNGLWKLHYAKSPALVVPGFERVDVDDSGWDDVPVPAHVQLLGYDRRSTPTCSTRGTGTSSSSRGRSRSGTTPWRRTAGRSPSSTRSRPASG